MGSQMFYGLWAASGSQIFYGLWAASGSQMLPMNEYSILGGSGDGPSD
jgi:hypothetical protein